MRKVVFIVTFIMMSLSVMAQAEFIIHEISSGETLDTIAEQYGVDKATIIEDNNIQRVFHEGGKLKIRLTSSSIKARPAKSTASGVKEASAHNNKTAVSSAKPYKSGHASSVANTVYGLAPGDFSLEVQFNPFSNNFQTFALDGVKLQGRYCVSGSNVIRMSLGFGIDNNTPGNTLAVPDHDSYTSEESYQRALMNYDLKKGDKTTVRTGEINLGAGYEKHWMVAERLDIFAGAQVGLAFNWANQTTITNYGDFNYDTMKWDSTWKETRSTRGKSGDKNSSVDISASAFTGLDFYVYKGLFVGAELGLYMNEEINRGYTETWRSTQKGIKVSSTTKEYHDTGNSFNCKFNVMPALRLGWTF